jgi:hypothetical protein
MPNWVTLSGDNIRLLDTEVTIMASVSPLQDLDTCVLNACGVVRGYIAGGGNILEPAPTVPPECVDDVISIARFRYLAQEPTGTLISKVRQIEHDDAFAHLRDIAAEKAAVTQADVPPTSEQFGKWGSAKQVPMRTDTTTP